MTHQFQFVNISKPTKYASSESRKVNHSHVMRHVHAKKRRLRNKNYQTEQCPPRMPQDLMVSKTILPSLLIERFVNSKDPFSSSARPLSSNEYWLLDYYVQVVMPNSIGHCKLYNSDKDYQKNLLQDWVGLAITDDVFMTVAILLTTCRYILLNRPGDPVFKRIALWYKQASLRSFRLEIQSESSSVSVMSVAKALAFAIDEVTSGEHGIARKHLEGVIAMVQLKGGPKSLGLTDLLERMYHKFLGELGFADANRAQFASTLAVPI